MSVEAMAQPDFVRAGKRFLRTPKGIVLLLLGLITALAVAGQGASEAVPHVLSAMAAAAVADVAVQRLARKLWVFPSGGLLSGLIIALVLAPQEPWIVPVAAAVLAVASKHLFRTRLANVFNPAALALVIATVLWDSGQSWWGALPELGWAGVPVLLGTGVFMADRINKLPLVLAFLGPYFAWFTVTSFLGQAGNVAEIFRAPDLQAVLFFAFFMVDDPPTCPVRYRDQVVFGVIVAASCYLFFQAFGWVYFLPAGLLVGNAWEGWRKRSVRRRVRVGGQRALV